MEPLLAPLPEMPDSSTPMNTQSGTVENNGEFSALLTGELQKTEEQANATNTNGPQLNNEDQEVGDEQVIELASPILLPENNKIPDLDGKLSADSTAIHTLEIPPLNLSRQQLPLQGMDVSPHDQSMGRTKEGLLEQNMARVLSGDSPSIDTNTPNTQLLKDTSAQSQVPPAPALKSQNTPETTLRPVTITDDEMKVSIEKWSAVFSNPSKSVPDADLLPHDRSLSATLTDLQNNTRLHQRHSPFTGISEQITGDIRQGAQNQLTLNKSGQPILNLAGEQPLDNPVAISDIPVVVSDNPVVAGSGRSNSTQAPLRLDAESQYIHSNLASATSGFVGGDTGGGTMNPGNKDAFNQMLMNQVSTSAGLEDSLQEPSPFTLAPLTETTATLETGSLSMKLPSGLEIPESRLVDQVIDRFSVNHRLETGTVSLKLHPEELGELKLQILIERGNIKAHIVTENPQVQEILERQIPRLRETLAEHGFNLDDMVVTVAAEDNTSQFSQENQTTAEQHQQHKTVPLPLNLDLIDGEEQEQLHVVEQGLSVHA